MTPLEEKGGCESNSKAQWNQREEEREWGRERESLIWVQGNMIQRASTVHADAIVNVTQRQAKKESLGEFTPNIQ